MQILDWIISKQLEKKHLASFSCLVLLYMFTHAVALAQQPGAQSPSTPFGSTGLHTPVQDITMAGKVEQLVTTTGTPAGLQLAVDGQQGSFTASLGSSLSREMQQSLSQGASVQISGTMQTIDGKQYLIARKLTINGKQTIIRNENGFLVHAKSRSGASVNNSALYRSAK